MVNDESMSLTCDGFSCIRHTLTQLRSERLVVRHPVAVKWPVAGLDQVAGGFSAENVQHNLHRAKQIIKYIRKNMSAGVYVCMYLKICNTIYAYI